MSLKRAFWQPPAAPKFDLAQIINREASGLTDVVKNSCKPIVSPVENIGIVGFTIVQYGQRYNVRFMDDNGNDAYSFTAIVPSGQPYLRTNPQLGVAEKAHMLMLVLQSMDENYKSQQQRALYELEHACFDVSTGQVKQGVVGVRQLPQGIGVLGHIGLRFPDDADYTVSPDLVVLAMEWIKGPQHFLIDCSDYSEPKFIVAPAHSPDTNRKYMSRDLALKAVDHAQKYLERHNPGFYALARQNNLWPLLEVQAEWLSTYTPQFP